MTATEDFCITELTPSAVSDIISGLGGGMVSGIVIAVELIGIDGERRPLVLWDNESGLMSQIGLADSMVSAVRTRRDMGWAVVGDDDCITDG